MDNIAVQFATLRQDQRTAHHAPAKALPLRIEPEPKLGSVSNVTAVQQVASIQRERVRFSPVVEVVLEYLGIHVKST